MLSDDVLCANIAFSNIFISGFNNSWDQYVRYVGIFLLVAGWYRFYKLLVEWPGIAREIKKNRILNIYRYISLFRCRNFCIVNSLSTHILLSGGLGLICLETFKARPIVKEN